MKMQNEHYETLKLSITYLGLDKCKTYAKKLEAEGGYQDFNTRLMYDLLRFCKLSGFICDVLYKYLDDSHIKTALMKIGNELQLTK